MVVCTENALKEFLITPALDTALRHLRHPTETITLWIDQICFDQKNTVEKNAQVPLMSQIYRQAEEVLSGLDQPLKSRTGRMN